MWLDVESCCCCIKLRTGSLIIGYFYLFFQVCTIIISCAAFGIGSYIEYNEDEGKEVGTIILIVFSILLIIKLWNILFTTLLLVGVHKDRPDLVKTYLVYTAMFLIVSVTTVVSKIASGHITPLYLAFKFSEITFGTYFYIVIRSHYHQMEGDFKKIPAIYNGY